MQCSDFYQTPVVIRVGPEAYPFHTFKELLCHDSSFFKAAFEGQFLEATKQTVSLPEDDVDTFKIYQTWLTTTQLRYNFDDGDWWLCFTKLWVFADKIGAVTLRNKVMDAMLDTVKKHPETPRASPHAVIYMYETMSGDCPVLTVFLTHFLSSTTTRKDFTWRELRAYPSAFLAGLAFLLIQHGQDVEKWPSVVKSLKNL